MPSNLIVLVEDNPDDAELALRALEKNNVNAEVKLFSDGEQALEYLLRVGRSADESGEPTPQLVLLDLKLPKLSGFEVLQRLRAEMPTTLPPVVVLTTSNDDGDIIESYKYGANSYIRKPVDFSQFIQAVGDIAKYWLRLNETTSSQTDTI